jgi:hypothetical protein
MRRIFLKFFSRWGGTIRAPGTINSTGRSVWRVTAELKARILGARFRRVRRFSAQLGMLGLSLIFARSWRGRANRPEDDWFSDVNQE